MLDKVAAGAAGSVTYSAIDAIDWADVLAFEAGIAGYDVADASFVMSPAARAALKGIEKAAGTAQFLCDGDNNINGYVKKTDVTKVSATPVSPFPTGIKMKIRNNNCNLRTSTSAFNAPSNWVVISTLLINSLHIAKV